MSPSRRVVKLHPAIMATPNYNYEKRQRELAKKKKKEEKLKERESRKVEGEGEAPSSDQPLGEHPVQSPSNP
ncbi:MAG: hypothetical protein ACKVPZ_02855 [Burkholderiaceae bacterium]